MTDRPLYWSLPHDKLFHALGSSASGLSEAEAIARRKENGREIKVHSLWMGDLLLFAGQFRNPFMLILIVAVVLASVLGEYTNSIIILSIILVSSLLSFWQERNAGRALQKLRALVQVYSTVVRDEAEREIPALEVVPGDIVMLNAGDIIPGDGLLVEARDLHVNEAVLTGESFPAAKDAGILPGDTPLNKRRNSVFQGTSVVNGTARVLIIHTGKKTEFGKISAALEKRTDENAFGKGVRKFGYMVMRATMLLSLLILTLNIYFGKPVSESVLFALALAVGMAPELLPAIVTIMLSAGARRMAKKKVIVKTLASIQNLGAINVFCSDKTGTLTEGVVTVQYTVDMNGNHWDKVKTFGYLNARFETGFTNPLDEAIRNVPGVRADGYTKVDEVPYDFIRKRLSIAVAYEDQHVLITKGALKNILEVCEFAAFSDGRIAAIDEARNQIGATHQQYSAQGFRTIGVCYKDITGDPVIDKSDERNMIFLGMVVLADPIKPGVDETIRELRESGISLKLITGDNALVAAYVAGKIGLKSHNLITGPDLRKISDEALAIRVNETDVFAEAEPFQKERIVRAMQKAGNVVGYIGDGINDASALKSADVGISVDTAVDVARETAGIVLLERDLRVLREGILEGRKTFINTLKYIFITLSANFGNMFSVAGASLFLPFLPLLPKQILLLNLLTDLPAMAIASDRVDSEQLSRPRTWDSKLIRKFMIVFGIESSLFDFLTFGILVWFFQASPSLFQTGWFLESAFTEVFILLIVRTQRPFAKSRPGDYLMLASLTVIVMTVVLPFLQPSRFLGFTPLPWRVIAGIFAIACIYGLAAEFTKRVFFRRVKF
ncbi:MAG TPA: magnesium-translocating P-type ATPase [Chryseosolibacter sp.]